MLIEKTIHSKSKYAWSYKLRGIINKYFIDFKSTKDLVISNEWCSFEGTWFFREKEMESKRMISIYI